MRKMFLSVLLLLLLLCRQSGSETASTLETYPYRVFGATGSNQEIFIDGFWVDVHLTDESNQSSLRALYGLRWEVLDRNAGGDKIFIRGRLLSSTRTDPLFPQVVVRDFVLEDWHILTPFEEYEEPEGWIPGDNYNVLIRESLTRESFRWEIDDPARFQKQQESIR